MNLIELKQQLRDLPKSERAALTVAVHDLVEGYRHLRETAPRRAQSYLSDTRTGLTASGETTTRGEEHLALGLFNRQLRELVLPNDERLRLIDYQFPLKSVRADAGVGKIDLLGLFPDGRLAVVELKVQDNAEDRRIGLLEGLIYAAIVEANVRAS